MLSPCIICNDNRVTVFTTDDNWDDFKENQAYVLNSFCRYFRITLPLPSMQWDFTRETVPFCPNCFLQAERLVKLNRKLEMLKEELGQIQGWVKSQIINISSHSPKNELKGWSCEDPRIQTIRDIIVGPSIKLIRVPLTSQNVPTIQAEEETAGTHCKETEEIQETFLPEDLGNESGGDLNNSPELSPGIPSVEDETVEELEEDGSFQGMEQVQKDSEDEDADDFDVGPYIEDYHKLGLDAEDPSTETESDSPDDDDPEDEDFSLPEDAKEFLAEDSRLTKEVEWSLRRLNKKKQKETPDTPEAPHPEDRKRYRPYPVKILEGKNRFLYGGRLEFTGTKKEGYKCCQCNDNKSYPKKRLYIHFRRFHLSKLKCDICKQELADADEWKEHRKSHWDSSPLICEVCGKSLKGKRSLKVHMEAGHKELQAHTCKDCGKDFKCKASLTSHFKRIHLQVKNYCCELCGKGYFDNVSLQVHLNSNAHSKEKPFVCDLCGSGFKLDVHRKRHIQQFHINPLNKNLPDQEPTGDPNLRCQYCGLQYRAQTNLNRHLLKIHHINVKDNMEPPST